MEPEKKLTAKLNIEYLRTLDYTPEGTCDTCQHEFEDDDRCNEVYATANGECFRNTLRICDLCYKRIFNVS